MRAMAYEYQSAGNQYPDLLKLERAHGKGERVFERHFVA